MFAECWRGAVSASALALSLCVHAPACAQEKKVDQAASIIADLQRQIDELKAVVDQLKAAQSLLAETSTEPPKAASTLPEQVPPAVTRSAPETAALPQRQAWHEKFQLRGYTQLRINEIVSGASIAPPGRSRLRSMHDGDLRDGSNFSFRRLRMAHTARRV